MSLTDIPSWSMDIAKTIMEQVRVKDAETYFHCVRVSRGSRLLARAAGLSEVDQKTAEFAGLFHDIGKIGIPNEILNKPSHLTTAEHDVMKDHPELSVRLLAPLMQVDFFKRLVPGVRYHHEWYDGSGYPHCLKGEQIPLAARVVMVADTFDAITADRVYRKGRPTDVAYSELRDWAGAQFDPFLVKIFLQAHPTWGAPEHELFSEMNHLVLKVAA